MTKEPRTIEPAIVVELPDALLGLECGFCSGSGVEPEMAFDDPDDRRIFVCQVCSGKGFNTLAADSAGALICKVCGGDGQIPDESGYYVGDLCPVCRGKGFLDLSDVVVRSGDHDVWSLIHPAVRDISRPRFDAGHYADSVEAAFKHFNARVKACVPSADRGSADGSSLMELVFSANDPLISLVDPSDSSARDEQIGYMKMFAGAMTGIRNPKAHDNIDISASRALHHLMVASLFCYRLDEALQRQRAGS